MYIKKLVITPLDTLCSKYETYCPSRSTASRLIKERLSVRNPYDTKSVPRKMPAFLKGWVNPETIVVKRDSY